MATGADFVKGALRKLGTRNSESPIESYEMTDGIEVFNDMMTELEPIVNLGFTAIAQSSDEVNVPRDTHDAIKNMLAVRLAPDYDVVVSPALAESTRASFNNLLINNQRPINVKFPDTLSLGSGNNWCGDDYFNEFFPQNNRENF